MITPLHNHSMYSSLDGLSTPQEIVGRCLDLGCTSCGLTDHGVVTGHLAFAKEMTKAGLKPIFGCELYHGIKWEGFKGQERDQAHFVALAMTDEGLRNLWRLVDITAREDHFRYVGRVDWESLRKHAEGVVATSACMSGLVPQGIVNEDYDALNRYLDIYGDNFYIELHTYPGDKQKDLNIALASIAQERGIGLVYANDAHYAYPEQYEIHDAYVAISTKGDIYEDPSERRMWHPKALYIQSEEEVRENLSYLPESAVDEAIRNAEEIGARADAQLPEIERHLPVFVPSESSYVDEKYVNPSLLFIDLVEQGVKDRYPNASDEVWDRAADEMEVFLNAGLEHYFLLAWEVCQFCDAEGIERGPGRGSSAGCLVAYALGITDVDPLRYGLIFERFFNAGREDGFPDIDSDFEKSKRHEIRDFLSKRWGADNVRPIGNTIRMKPKAVLDRIWHACAVTYEEKEALKRIINEVPDLDILGVDQIGWAEDVDPGKVIYVEDSVGDKIVEWIGRAPEDRQDFLARFVEIARVMCSRVSNYGVHASGIVVSDVSLPDELPARFAASKDQRVAVTQFPMEDVDKRKFIKLDVLGLRTLDVLADWKRQMVENHDIEIPWSRLDEQEHPDGMWEMLANGFGAGIFQIEGGFAQKLSKKFKPRSIEDLAIIVSLNRPGPIRSGAPASFITRRHGGTDDRFDGRKIPLLADILEPTYGWFLYQEQVIAYFNALGYTLGESDAVRKILGKKQPEKLAALHDGLGEWEGRSYVEMTKAAGLDKDTAETIWVKLEEFAKYSFNKSHAVAYAVIGFRTLFAKYYGGPEFYLACIRNVPNDKKADMVPQYIAEARRQGINVLPPDILRSKAQASIDEGDILFGFSDVKGVGLASARALEQWRDSGVNVTTPELLWAFIERETKHVLAAHEKGTRTKKTHKQTLQENKLTALFTAGAWDTLGEREIGLAEVQKCEKDFLGVILTDNSDEILALHPGTIAECYTPAEVDQPWDGEDQFFDVCGTISSIRETVTKKDKKKMAIATVEYQGDAVEFAVFSRQWSAYKFLFKERAVGVFTLRRSESGINFDRGYRL